MDWFSYDFLDDRLLQLDDEENETRNGFIDQYELQYQILIYFLIGYAGYALFIYILWRFYPLPEDERTSWNDLVAAIFSVFLLVGDYLTDALVMLVLITSLNKLSDGTNLPDVGTISLESFTLVVILISGCLLIISTGILTYLGKHNEELNYHILPFRFVLVSTGLYQLYLLFELVSVRIFGEARATLDDIVVLKYYHAKYESIPQIGMIVFLAFSGVQDIDQVFLFISLLFSVTTLVSSLVMNDYLRDVGKDDYDNSNDYNYLFFNEQLSSPNNYYARREWVIKSLITRLLECLARISFYSMFALATRGWGVLVIIGVDILGLLYYHGYFFFFNAFWEALFNLNDGGNVHVAWGEWKVKFLTTCIGYIIIGVVVGNNPELVAIEIPQNFGLFLVGILANLMLYPWILFLFREQRLRGYDDSDYFDTSDKDIISY